eukprot:TRINITY_DN15018_c0_g1_i1.p1 TRINITY_DN15018_c0_g1~~TRINITY_DN15018_c0_g1_i1.p1  ORF type:complete len:484 (+),score=103.96 TRINITY_DN15018_c0_g1_i1:411-1862(+)
MPPKKACQHLKGTCPVAPLTDSHFCSHHTCPKCGLEKSSKEKWCDKCADRKPSPKKRASPRPKPKAKEGRASPAGGKGTPTRIAGTGKAQGRIIPNNEEDMLKALLQEGNISRAEFDRRIKVLKEKVNEVLLKPHRTPRSAHEIPPGRVTAIAKARTQETVFKYTFDYKAKKWCKSMLLAYIEPKPFDEGAMRAAYRMFDLTKPEGQDMYVAKMAKDKKEAAEIYFVDAEMQAMCQWFAEEYNKRGVPKPVEFVDAFLIECYSRDDRAIMACEPFLEGEYVKYSNNYGYVAPDDRNTPQAFSHFTHWHSNGRFIVVDVQGVGDKYTDPQVHSKDGEGFGKGNVGQEGIDEFFKSHKCNSICKLLGLTDKIEDFKGTRTKLHRPKNLDYNTDPSEDDLLYFGLDRAQYDAILQKFKMSDSDGSGEISLDELPKLCRELELEIPTDQLVNVMANVDRDGSGEISLLEFLTWWTGHEDDMDAEQQT